jgi:hypothetical protein
MEEEVLAAWRAENHPMSLDRVLILGGARTAARLSYSTTANYAALGSHAIGLIGEVWFAECLGCAADLTDQPAGDGGRDFQFQVRDVARSVKINLQTRTNRRGAPLDIAVPASKVGRADIHVLLELDDRLLVVGAWWTWETVLLRACPEPRTLPGREVPNHYMSVRPRLIARTLDDELGPRLLAATQVFV